MFDSVINDLKTKEILSSSDVKELREYINHKYPQCSSQQVSLILADAIKKIINSNISQFEDCYKQEIRDSILMKTIQKRIFSINAEDIFTSCAALNIVSDDYISSLTEWINKYQASIITKNQVKEFAETHLLQELIKQELPEQQAYTQEHIQVYMQEQESGKQYKSKINLKQLPLSYKEGLLGWLKNNKLSYKVSTVLVFVIICLTAFSLYSNTIITVDSDIEGTKERILDIYNIKNIFDNQSNKSSHSTEYLYSIEYDLHEDLKYKAVDKEALIGFLQNRNSILAQEPFFTTIIDIAQQYDVNPLLMFAITGQEQGFVPADLSQARKIANNPFNVYGSWQKYNTDISDSAAITARTIHNLGKNRPVYRDPIEWINRKYAEDKNWWKNVRIIFKTLKSEISYTK